MAAGDFSTPAIGTIVEVELTIDGDKAFYEVGGLSNTDFNSPNVQRTTFDLLNGRSLQRTGSAQAGTLTAQMASNLSSPVFESLLNLKTGGGTARIRFSTAVAEELYDSVTPVGDPPAPGTAQVAISETTGICTFSGNTNLPNFGGADAGAYAVGHAIQIGNVLHRIKTIATTPAGDTGGQITVLKPDAAVTATAFKIVRPQAVLTFSGSITQIGNVSAAPGSAVNTDTLEISATQVITAGFISYAGV